MTKRPFAGMPALLTAVALAVAATPAVAGPSVPELEIELQSGGATYSQTGPSPLIVSQSIGAFSAAVNIGVATIAPTLDLSSLDISSGRAGGTLVITLSAKGFATPVGAAYWLSQFSGNIVIGSATVTLRTYLDNSNTLLGTGTALSTLSASSSFNESDMKLANTTADFAITEVLTVVTKGAAEVSLDASMVDAPEPGSLALLGSALIALAAVSRRRHTA